MVTVPDSCPICASRYMTYVRTLPNRLGGSVDLFYCMECESFSSPQSPPVPNPPTETEWHKSVLQRNVGWVHDLLGQLHDRGVSGPIVDIGCGIGSLLLGARERGISGVGYDLDSEACAFGRHEYELDLRGEEWTPETSPDFGLLTCVSVLEHIHQPRELISHFISEARRRDAHVYLSVPLINRDWWKFVHTDNLTPGHMFEIPHAHVTHFSDLGIRTVVEQLGATTPEVIRVDKGWLGYLFAAA